MFDVSGSALRIYRRLLGVKPPAEGEHAGVATATDGASALAVTEACVADAAALGGSFPATSAALMFRDEAERLELNHFQRPVRALDAQNGREGLAAAVGMALSGLRAAAFVSGEDLLEATDHLSSAAGRRLPLVVHLAARARSGRGGALGSGHDAVHAAAETGAAVFVAASVQEATDFALIGRRFAEDALLPVVVAADGAETALSVQNVLLPTPELSARFLGGPGDAVHPGTASQEMLFGGHRRRVPRWHDLERPSLDGALAGPESWALGSAARSGFLDAETESILAVALKEFGDATGRRHQPVSAYRVDDASVVFVALGSIVETLETAVDALRAKKVKAGAIGLRVLRPFPAGQLASLLKGKRLAVVIDRSEPAFGSESPLVREIRSVLGRAAENAALGAETHPGLPALGARDVPSLVTAYAGLGGFPVRVPDLEATATELLESPRSPVFVGIDFAPDSRAWPKRDVLLSALRRAWPRAGELGVLSGDAARAIPDTTTFAVHRVAGRGGESLLSDLALLAHRLLGGSVRTRSALAWESWDADLVDRLVQGPEGSREPGDGVPADLLMWHSNEILPRRDATRVLRDGGAFVFEPAPGARSAWESLPAALRRDVKTRNLRLFVMKPQPESDASLRDERLLGALVAVLRAEGKIELPLRKLLGVRRALLEDTGDPAREARLAAFQIGLESTLAVEISTVAAPERVHDGSDEIETPLALRNLGRAEDTLDKLQRFWDQTGVFYRTGETAALSPDPYFATGQMPALTSTFRDHSRSRDLLPEFHPALCTGCGDCWSVCPDSALGPIAIGPGKLIETAMKQAREAGRNAEPLRMAASKLAQRVNEALAAQGGGPAGPLFDAAYVEMMKKMPLAEERKAALEEAFRAVRDIVADVPLARTAPFFSEPEAAKKGSGELFALGINPQACKGCGVCVAACEPLALTRDRDTAERTALARSLWKLLAEMPDPEPETVERMRARPAVGPLAGALLQREARLSLAGGDGAEAGSGEKIALRQTLAAMEYHLLPRAARTLAMVDEIREKLADAVRSALAGALPVADLEALARGIGAFDRPDTDIAEFTSRVETAFETGRVDLRKLKLLVATAQEVHDLRWRLVEGQGGLGRARFGLVVAAGESCSWAASFPHNPFHVPVTAEGGPDGAALARGILEGQYQEVLEGVRTLRRAKIALERPGEAQHLETTLARLTWRDLTPEERELAPALVLVGTDATLGGAGRSGLAALLDGELPVKVLLLGDPGGDLGSASSLLAASLRAEGGAADPELMPLAHPWVYVAQTSIGHPEHIEKAMADALNHPGPAVVRVIAPLPYAHGFPREAAPARARMAVKARAYPLFAFTPTDYAGTPPKLDLSANPEPESAFAKDERGGLLTFAHWAAGEARFARHFTPVTSDDADQVPVGEYLLLDPEEQAGKTPVVCCGDDELPRRVSAAMLEASARRLRAWRVLQHLAKSRALASRAAVEEAVAEASAALRAEHQAAMADQARQYEDQIYAVRNEGKVEMAQQVRHRLLTLLNRGAGNGHGEE